jgi:ABC transport system ATP-binding/permease protein
VLIARLMLEPADVLLLDEPTNDLDLATLEILEENLLEFPGALVLVTHDRYLLNRVASTVVGLNGKGRAERFADYAQWETWLHESDFLPDPAKGETASPAKESGAAPQKKKLSYLEAREFATIERRVEESDERLATARDRIEDPAISSDAAALQQAIADLDAAEHESQALYARWAELTDKAG